MFNMDEFNPDTLTDDASFLCAIYPGLYTLITGFHDDDLAHVWKHY